MRFNPDNFLYLIKQLVTGLNGDSITDSGTASSADGGISKDVPLGEGSVVLVSGTAFKLSTITNLTTVPVLETASGDSSIGATSIQIPRDYDEASDHFSLRLNVVLGNAGDAGDTLVGTPAIITPGVAISATNPAIKTAVTAVTPFTTTNASLSTTPQTVEITLNGYGLLRDQVISIGLAYGTALGSGVADVLSAQYHYDSTIVSYNETDTTDVPGGGANATGFGNPLR
jgi:hypothetical protein